MSHHDSSLAQLVREISEAEGINFPKLMAWGPLGAIFLHDIGQEPKQNIYKNAQRWHTLLLSPLGGA